ncbi:MAG: LptF/LptG family permease [Holosporales bacterium]|jgi:lipopolysaccharide export system permease protein|nr:LptF/LptG family permease [Holosporales bacterium]
MQWVHWRYLLKLHLKSLLGVVFTVALIIFILTFIETLRRMRWWDVIPLGFLTSTALYRLPNVIALLFPYMYLIATGLTLESLASSRQMTVLQASGYSIWQILSPFLWFAGFLSAFWFWGLQPLSVYLYGEIQFREQTYFSSDSTVSRNNLWLHQQPTSSSGVLLQVGHMGDTDCSDISVYRFSQNGGLEEVLFAKTLHFDANRWTLSQGTLFDPDSLEYRPFSNRQLENSLDISKILPSLQSPKDLGIYDIFSTMKVRKEGHLSEREHAMTLHALGAKAVLIFFMVLLAGCLQIRHSRLGKGLSVAQTLLCGLLLHFSTDIFSSFGLKRVLSPFWAGWTPALLTGAIALIGLIRKGER